MLTLTKPKETFDFQLEGSETVYSIPFPKDLPVSMTQELAKLADSTVEEALGFFERLLNRYAPGVWEQLSMEQLNMLFEAWGGGLGER